MTIRRLLSIVSTLAFLGVAAACVPSPEAGPTAVAIHSPSIQAVNSIPTETKSPRPTQKLYSSPTKTSTLPARSKTLTRTITPTPTALDLSPNMSFVLEGFMPQGAQARLGRGRINQVAVSPDGNTVAVAGATGLSLFDLDSFQEIWSVPTRKGIEFLTFIADGRTIASLSTSRSAVDFYLYRYDLPEIHIWETRTGRLLQTLPLDAAPYAFAFSGDGRTFALGMQDGSVQVWDLPTGRLRSILDLKDPIYLLALSKGGEVLAVESPGLVTVWDTSTWEKMISIAIYIPQEILALSPSGELLAIQDFTLSDIYLFHTRADEDYKTLRGFTSSTVDSLAFSPDGKSLAAVNSDEGTVFLWDIAGGSSIRSAEALGKGIHSLVFLPDGSGLLIGAEDSIRLMDLGLEKTLRALSEPFSRWNGAVYDPEGGRLTLQASGKILDVNSGTWDSIRGYVYPQLAIPSADLRMYAYFSANLEAVIADIRTGTIRNTLPISKDTPAYDFGDYFHFSPDGGRILFWNPRTSPPVVEVWSLAANRFERTLEFLPSGEKCITPQMVFSPDGGQVAFLCSDGKGKAAIIAFDVKDGRQTGLLQDMSGLTFALSPDRRTAAVAVSADDRLAIRLHDLTGGTVGESLESPQEDVGEPVLLIYSADGLQLACGTDRGNLLLWDIPSRKLIRVFQGQNEPVQSISFSPESDYLASGSMDGTVIVWNIKRSG